MPVLISLKDEYATHLSRKIGISTKSKKEKELGFTALYKGIIIICIIMILIVL